MDSAWPIAIGVLSLIAGTAVVQAVCVLAFIRALQRGRRPPPTDLRRPPATVILPVRGADPRLRETLDAVAAQDYPDFEVRIVLDSVADPAREILEAWQAERRPERVCVQILQSPSPHCSLKNNALIQALRELPDACEVVAILDGDVIPHPTWLRDLVGPLLSDPRAGAATGNRWYSVRGRLWGTRVRYFWNTAAVVQMWFNRMAWAGSLALKAAAIRETGMRELWGRSLSTDAVIHRQLRRHGYRCVFAPAVMMLNAEETPLGSFVGWVRRQLTTARLYHPGWTVVLAHAVYMLAIHTLGPLACVAAWLSGQAAVAGTLLAAGAAYWGTALAFALALESAVQAVARGPQPPAPQWSLRTIGGYLGAMVLTHSVYWYALWGAMHKQSVAWRGIEYRIRGPFDIEASRHTAFAHRPASVTSLV
jgi:cellulose synthase/poly-beta-1,6-N-acetylglucosamine synthase-like glycosyltransferase